MAAALLEPPPGFPVPVQEDLSDYVNNPELSDVIFKVEDERFFAHRFILARRCVYFRRAFLEFEGFHGLELEVEIRDSSPSVFLGVLTYIYSGKLDLSTIPLWDVFLCAQTYKLAPLQEQVENHLADQLDVDNVCGVWAQAQIYGASRLVQACTDFFRLNLEDVVQTRSFAAMGAHISSDLVAPGGPLNSLVESDNTNANANNRGSNNNSNGGSNGIAGVSASIGNDSNVSNNGSGAAAGSSAPSGDQLSLVPDAGDQSVSENKPAIKSEGSLGLPPGIDGFLGDSGVPSAMASPPLTSLPTQQQSQQAQAACSAMSTTSSYQDTFSQADTSTGGSAMQGTMPPSHLLPHQQMQRHMQQTMQPAQTPYTPDVPTVNLFHPTSSHLDHPIEQVQVLMNLVACLCDSDRATLFLFERQTNELCSVIVVADQTLEIRLPSHMGIAGAVFGDGKLLNVPEAYNDSRFLSQVDRMTGFRTQSLLCAPVEMSMNGDLVRIGVVEALNKRTGQQFTPQDEHHIVMIAEQVATLMERGHLSMWRQMCNASSVSVQPVGPAPGYFPPPPPMQSPPIAHQQQQQQQQIAGLPSAMQQPMLPRQQQQQQQQQQQAYHANQQRGAPPAPSPVTVPPPFAEARTQSKKAQFPVFHFRLPKQGPTSADSTAKNNNAASAMDGERSKKRSRS